MIPVPRRRVLVPVLVLVVLAFVTVGDSLARLPQRLLVRSADYIDLDGDHDAYPDSGETGRLVLTIQNPGPAALEDVVVNLSSSDPDVACVPEWSMAVGDLAIGQIVSIGSPVPGTPGFSFKVSNSLQTTSPTNPARIDLCLRYTAAGRNEFSALDCFSIVADLDLPAPGQTFINGPDGLPGTSDDGKLLETFDVDRNGDSALTVNDTFRQTDAGTGATTSGFYQRGAAASGPTTIAGIVCGGFQTAPEGNVMCALDPDFPMDWHFHCPPGGPCPNIETGTCVGGCSYSSAVPKALSLPNSLHMGAHFVPANSSGDTTHLRALQAFVSSPLNMTANPRPGDLDMSVYQIVDLMDDNGVGPGNQSQCSDCADIQVQVDQNPDPAIDSWGFWDKLVAYQNVYDHVANAASTFAPPPIYCLFTPGDTGTAPPNPRGTHETMCYAQGAWSHCGSSFGTAATKTFDCPGPGVIDPSGTGVWVQSRFNLSSYVGQRVRLRWVGSSWTFDGSADTYYEAGGSWALTQHDDGWWLDDIQITGVTTSQLVPLADAAPSPGGTCPAVACTDSDGDGYGDGPTPPCFAGVPLDCDPLRASVHPGALEISDGIDNQCPGDEGYGITDEIDAVFLHSNHLVQGNFGLCWTYLSGATSYQIVSSTRKDFSGSCTVQVAPPTDQLGCVAVPAAPPMGGALYHRARALAPYVGSWGRNSAGQEVVGICGLP